MGAAINSKTLPLLRCAAISGSANNQLASEDLGTELHNRGILYTPDFVVSSGGIINAAMEFEPSGYNAKVALEKVDRIYDTLREIFETAEIRDLTPCQVANEVAESKIACGVGKREASLPLH
jgi:leucine dehydrogenase